MIINDWQYQWFVTATFYLIMTVYLASLARLPDLTRFCYVVNEWSLWSLSLSYHVAFCLSQWLFPLRKWGCYLQQQPDTGARIIVDVGILQYWRALVSVGDTLRYRDRYLVNKCIDKYNHCKNRFPVLLFVDILDILRHRSRTTDILDGVFNKNQIKISLYLPCFWKCIWGFFYQTKYRLSESKVASHFGLLRHHS